MPWRRSFKPSIISTGKLSALRSPTKRPSSSPERFPSEPTADRSTSATSRQVFEQIRARRTKGPYLAFKPRNLKIEIAGDVAIVTFHLDDRPGFVNRRTVILRKFIESWKIIHLHACEVSIPAR
jgi:ketosteroid isomerase-like protein